MNFIISFAFLSLNHLVPAGAQTATPLKPETVSAQIEANHLRETPEFVGQRNEALRNLTAQQKKSILKDIQIPIPFEKLFEETDTEIGVCEKNDYAKLKSKYPLLVLLRLYSLENEFDSSKIKDEMEDRFDQLGTEGAFNKYSALKKYYQNVKIVAVDPYLSRLKSNEPTKKFIKKQKHESELRKLTLELQALGLKKTPAQLVLEARQMAPGCFYGRFKTKLDDFVEHDRMLEEARLLSKKIEEFAEATGTTPRLRTDLQSEKDDLIMRSRDAWGTNYYIEKVDTNYFLRSLGPDKFLSSDDIRLATLKIKLPKNK